MNRLLVYLACPITAGNRNKNYYQACEAERILMLEGFAPCNPAHTAVLPFAWQPEYTHSMWLDCCFPLIERMDAVMRLPGYSVGADAELQHAMKHDIPCFHNIMQLIDWRETKESVTA